MARLREWQWRFDQFAMAALAALMLSLMDGRTCPKQLLCLAIAAGLLTAAILMRPDAPR